MRTEEVILSKPRKGTHNVVTFDEVELRVRLFEAMVERRRPPGQSAKEAWATVQDAEIDMADAIARQAHVAMEYVVERMRSAELEAMQ